MKGELEALDFSRVVAHEMKTELKDLLFPLFSGISNVSKDQMGWRSGGAPDRLILSFDNFQFRFVGPVNF